MLTRLKVNGFKNLVNVDVRFGAFTCIAGVNGVGKSNLFDAIQFLSSLADLSLIEAALSVRDKSRTASDICSLFHRIGEEYAPEMSFEAEMIIPQEGVDDLGQKAVASNTFLRYSLVLAYHKNMGIGALGELTILREELIPLKSKEAPENLLFSHPDNWRTSVIKANNRTTPFISTDKDKEKKTIIKLYQEGRKGKPLSRLAETLPRTVLSATNAAESPTASLARIEMKSWQLLQLEPSSLRKSNEFTDPTKLSSDGSYLAATLYHLANNNSNQIYAQVASRLAELLDNIDTIWVDRDDRRQLLTIMVKDRNGTIHPAKSLSDGTMRFLALVTLELDFNAQVLLCLEEPENGIHPERIPKILELLQDIAFDVEEPMGLDNPLRQVIINTHSPAVVQQVPDDSLLVAELKEDISPKGERFKRVCFNYLPDTWRAKDPNTTAVCVSKGQLLAYLNPVSNSSDIFPEKQRVRDRKDLQFLLPGI